MALKRSGTLGNEIQSGLVVQDPNGNTGSAAGSGLQQLTLEQCGTSAVAGSVHIGDAGIGSVLVSNALETPPPKKSHLTSFSLEVKTLDSEAGDLGEPLEDVPEQVPGPASINPKECTICLPF